MSRKQLLVLVVANELKDNVVDALIGLQDVSGFSLSNIEGYSREHHQLSLREQVAGHQGMARFEVIHESSQEQVLLAALESVCGLGEAHYWIMPLARSGRL